MASKKPPAPAFTIEIDDLDRGERTTRPWTATAYTRAGDSVSMPGFGATPALALDNLIAELDVVRPDSPDFFTDQEA